MLIFIIGYMGSGKSSVGRIVAHETGFAFVDMDREIEARCRMSVTEIFETLGQEWFRLRESEEVRRLASLEGDMVVAAGGGAPCFGDNMDVIKEAGYSVYLKMSAGQLTSRLRPGQPRRPLLKGMDAETLRRHIAEDLERRESFYLRADMTIDCSQMSDRDAARRIVDLIRDKQGLQTPPPRGEGIVV